MLLLLIFKKINKSLKPFYKLLYNSFCLLITISSIKIIFFLSSWFSSNASSYLWINFLFSFLYIFISLLSSILFSFIFFNLIINSSSVSSSSSSSEKLLSFSSLSLNIIKFDLKSSDISFIFNKFLNLIFSFSLLLILML